MNFTSPPVTRHPPSAEKTGRSTDALHLRAGQLGPVSFDKWKAPLDKLQLCLIFGLDTGFYKCESYLCFATYFQFYF